MMSVARYLTETEWPSKSARLFWAFARLAIISFEMRSRGSRPETQTLA